MNINVNEFFTTHLPRALSSTNSLDGKYFQLDESNEGNKIIIWNKNKYFKNAKKMMHNDQTNA